MAKTGSNIYMTAGKVYLTNDLGYDPTILSGMKMLFTPINILLSSRVGGMARSKPFQNLHYLSMINALVNSYAIFVLLGTFPTDKEE